MWSVSHHTALQTQEGKHKKSPTARWHLATLDRRRRSIEDEPRNLSYKFELPTPSDTSPSNVISLHHPHCTPTARKPTQENPTAQRHLGTHDRRRTMIGDEPRKFYNLDLSPNQMRSVSEAYEHHVERERAGEPNKTHHQHGRHLAALARSTDAGEWSETTHPGLGNCIKL